MKPYVTALFSQSLSSLTFYWVSASVPHNNPAHINPVSSSHRNRTIRSFGDGSGGVGGQLMAHNSLMLVIMPFGSTV